MLLTENGLSALLDSGGQLGRPHSVSWNRIGDDGVKLLAAKIPPSLNRDCGRSTFPARSWEFPAKLPLGIPTFVTPSRNANYDCDGLPDSMAEIVTESIPHGFKLQRVAREIV